MATEMKGYNLAVLGISETRWTEHGQQRIDSGELLLYSGHEEANDPHTEGAALMLSKEARNAFIEWESYGFRIVKASFKRKKKGITKSVIRFCAPNNYNNDVDKDQLSERLQSIIAKCSGKDLIMLMVDLSGKVGTENHGHEDIVGRYGVNGRENGNRFSNKRAFNKMVIGGTIFPHKRIQKATWVSPGYTTENQIDHIYNSKKFIRSMEDVRKRRGADVTSGHHLVVAMMKLKSKKNRTIR